MAPKLLYAKGAELADSELRQLSARPALRWPWKRHDDDSEEHRHDTKSRKDTDSDSGGDDGSSDHKHAHHAEEHPASDDEADSDSDSDPDDDDIQIEEHHHSTFTSLPIASTTSVQAQLAVPSTTSSNAIDTTSESPSQFFIPEESSRPNSFHSVEFLTTTMAPSTALPVVTHAIQSPSSIPILSAIPHTSSRIFLSESTSTAGTSSTYLADITEVAVVTPTSFVTRTSSSLSSAGEVSQATAEPERGNIHPHHPEDLSPAAKKALISVGTIGAVVLVAGIIWLTWRRFKKRQPQKTQSTQWHSKSQYPQSGLHQTWLHSCKMFYRKKFAARGWTTIDETLEDADLTSASDKSSDPQRVGQMHSAPRLDSQFFAPDQIMGIAAPRRSTAQAGQPRQSWDDFLFPVGAHISTTADGSTQLRNSDVSSYISSGFGDYDITVPTPRTPGKPKKAIIVDLRSSPAHAHQRLADGGIIIGPAPTSRRFKQRQGNRGSALGGQEPLPQEPAARFRTVTSWVKQQTGRMRQSTPSET